jgi:hypothetical protein
MFSFYSYFLLILSCSVSYRFVVIFLFLCTFYFLFYLVLFSHSDALNENPHSPCRGDVSTGGGTPGVSTAQFVCPCAISILEQCGGQEDILRCGSFCFIFLFYFVLFCFVLICFVLFCFVFVFVRLFSFLFLFFSIFLINFPFSIFFFSLLFYFPSFTPTFSLPFSFHFHLALSFNSSLFSSSLLFSLFLCPRVMPFLSCTDRETYLTLEYLRNSNSNSTFSDSSDNNTVRIFFE